MKYPQVWILKSKGIIRDARFIIPCQLLVVTINRMVWKKDAVCEPNLYGFLKKFLPRVTHSEQLYSICRHALSLRIP